MAKKLKPLVTKAQLKAYLDDPGKCPRCKSENVEGASWDLNDQVVSQEVYCCDCHLEWVDSYKFHSIQIIDRRQGAKT